MIWEHVTTPEDIWQYLRIFGNICIYICDNIYDNIWKYLRIPEEISKNIWGIYENIWEFQCSENIWLYQCIGNAWEHMNIHENMFENIWEYLIIRRMYENMWECIYCQHPRYPEAWLIYEFGPIWIKLVRMPGMDLNWNYMHLIWLGSVQHESKSFRISQKS